MQTVFIYTLEHPITEEVRYVGKTNNLKIRLGNHLCGRQKTHKVNWIKSLKSQGLIPVMKILDEVYKEDWIFWEVYWINQFKIWGFNLVNATNGGDGTAGLASKCKKPVKCFDLYGNLIKSFESATVASKELNCSTTHISDCCNGNIKSHRNKVWRYIDDDFSKFEVENNSRRKSILQYDLNGNLIAEYFSITQAAIELNCLAPSISRALRGGRKKFKNSIWKYKTIINE